MARVKLCPSGHRNPPGTLQCKECRLPLLEDAVEEADLDAKRPPPLASPILRFPFRDVGVPLGETLLGRDSSSPVGDALERADLLRVSKMHAIIERRESGLLIRDYPSRHGTFVNGDPIDAKPYRLHHGDIISLADQVACEVVIKNAD